MDVSSSAKRMSGLFHHLIVVHMPSVDWMVPTHIGEGDSLYSIC